jgi:hypothetical protein
MVRQAGLAAAGGVARRRRRAGIHDIINSHWNIESVTLNVTRNLSVSTVTVTRRLVARQLGVTVIGYRRAGPAGPVFMSSLAGLRGSDKSSLQPCNEYFFLLLDHGVKATSVKSLQL